MYQVKNKEVNCRKCGRTVSENSYHCPHCGAGAPGISSRCPKCKSENYVYHKYGYAILRAILATCVCGPLGPVFGFVGYNRTECICLDCKQGWFPFQKDEQLGPFNTFVGEEGKISREFKKIPNIAELNYRSQKDTFGCAKVSIEDIETNSTNA